MYRFLFIITVIYIGVQQVCNAQEHFASLSWEAPVQIAVGYQFQPIDQFSTTFQVGWLTDPNSAAILSSMEALGTDELVVDMVANAFESGLVMDLGINYHFRQVYVGAFLQRISLKGNDTPVMLVEQVMGVDINSFPRLSRATNQTELDLTLMSNLWQIGALVGKNWPLPGRSSLFLELAISANVGSKSEVSIESRDLSALSAEVDVYLADIYSSYAYVPSLHFGWRYQLGR